MQSLWKKLPNGLKGRVKLHCTLDIGTVKVVTLLATLFISKSQVSSYTVIKRKDVVKNCYDVMKLYGRVKLLVIFSICQLKFSDF